MERRILVLIASLASVSIAQVSMHKFDMLLRSFISLCVSKFVSIHFIVTKDNYPLSELKFIDLMKVIVAQNPDHVFEQLEYVVLTLSHAAAEPVYGS